MNFKADIGIIGALDDEVRSIIASLEDRRTERVGSVDFNLGIISGKRVAVARCGVGKVFAALCAEAMIVKYSPSLLVNTGVGGALDRGLDACDIVLATKLVQYDMDTTAFGDPLGMISGINKVYFETDERARTILADAADSLGLHYMEGTIATADRFVSTAEEKLRLGDALGAAACEMEGGAIAHVAYVNATPCMVIRAISDKVDGIGSMDYEHFLPIAVKSSVALTMALIEKY